MHPHRRQALVLVLMMGIVALLAQVAGVAGTKAPRAAGGPAQKTLAVIPGGSVPDLGSTKLESATIKAGEGDAIRMRATASVRATALPKRAVAQVVCGIRYSRAGDASWSLGTPYETVQLKTKRATEKVTIERSFTAPASDTYRMSVACHVASPSTGATVTGSGGMRAAVGLPSGAATPVE
ncbi:MAG: hypothetical protein JWL76_1541 [Thermoleophilia bacterium]|nr:hypothetical protein [Thermoleophilia bacterium]